jgi:hypothetical protein
MMFLLLETCRLFLIKTSNLDVFLRRVNYWAFHLKLVFFSK